MLNLIFGSVILFANLYLLGGLIMEEPTPDLLKECIRNNSENNYFGSSKLDIQRYCLDNLHTKNETDYISKDDINFLNNILDEIMSRKSRVKRQRFFLPVRREMRNLTRAEWNRFVRAVQILKRNGIYDRLSAIHSGALNLFSAHRGPNFLSWHRIFLIVFETWLQRVIPGVTLPYWDCTMDFDTTNPTRSVIWTDRYVGNGNGLVNSGPFANWRTRRGVQLMRNIGSNGTMITKAAIDLILSRTSHSEVTDANNMLYYFEGYHDGTHVWVDGHMRVLSTAADDPIFFLYHCFVDYIWELFRIRQQDRGIPSERDYPNVRGLHSANRRMAGFTRLRNIDGYLNYWTENFYTYAQTPACSNAEPSCYSNDLTCDLSRVRCVTNEVESSVSSILSVQFGVPRQEARFTSTPLRAPTTEDRRASIQGLALPEGPVFESFFFDGRVRLDPLPQRFSQFEFGQNPFFGFRMKRSLSHLDTKNISTKVVGGENGFMQTTESNTTIEPQDNVVYVPVSVISYQPLLPNSDSFVTEKGEIIYVQDLTENNKTRRYIKTGSTVAFVQSDGINYGERHRDVVITDIIHAISSTFSYIAVKNPGNRPVRAIITVHDNFGRICSPLCLGQTNKISDYKPCTGAIKVTTDSPEMYSMTYEQAIRSVWNVTNVLNPHFNDKDVFMKFICRDEIY